MLGQKSQATFFLICGEEFARSGFVGLEIAVASGLEIVVESVFNGLVIVIESGNVGLEIAGVTVFTGLEIAEVRNLTVFEVAESIFFTGFETAEVSVLAGFEALTGATATTVLCTSMCMFTPNWKKIITDQKQQT